MYLSIYRWLDIGQDLIISRVNQLIVDFIQRRQTNLDIWEAPNSKDIWTFLSNIMSETVKSTYYLLFFLFFYITDPQNEARVTSDQHGAHTDWLTLNIGGRPFTTTRYLWSWMSSSGVFRRGSVRFLSRVSSVLRWTGNLRVLWGKMSPVDLKKVV